MKAWYLDLSQKLVMLECYSNKLSALVLDNDMTATEFINKFDIYVRKIETFDSKWSEDKKIREFKKKVISQNYDVEKRVHKITMEMLVQNFRNEE